MNLRKKRAVEDIYAAIHSNLEDLQGYFAGADNRERGTLLGKEVTEFVRLLEEMDYYYGKALETYPSARLHMIEGADHFFEGEAGVQMTEQAIEFIENSLIQLQQLQHFNMLVLRYTVKYRCEWMQLLVEMFGKIRECWAEYRKIFRGSRLMYD